MISLRIHIDVCWGYEYDRMHSTLTDSCSTNATQIQVAKPYMYVRGVMNGFIYSQAIVCLLGVGRGDHCHNSTLAWTHLVLCFIENDPRGK